jgi:GxxExxY protein
MVVDEIILVEVKAIEELIAIHRVQLLTYLKLTAKPLGLLINFNVPVLWKGVRRVLNGI